MPHHKHHEKLEQIKEAIKNNSNLSEEEKSNALKHIEEWYTEDLADKVIWSELKEKLPTAPMKSGGVFSGNSLILRMTLLEVSLCSTLR